MTGRLSSISPHQIVSWASISFRPLRSGPPDKEDSSSRSRQGRGPQRPLIALGPSSSAKVRPAFRTESFDPFPEIFRTAQSVPASWRPRDQAGQFRDDAASRPPDRLGAHLSVEAAHRRAILHLAFSGPLLLKPRCRTSRFMPSLTSSCQDGAAGLHLALASLHMSTSDLAGRIGSPMAKRR